MLLFLSVKNIIFVRDFSFRILWILEEGVLIHLWAKCKLLFYHICLKFSSITASKAHPDSLEYYCQILFPLCSKWKEAHTSFKFILLTSFPTTDKSCDFQADIIQFDHLKQGECILTAWNITVRYCFLSVQIERRPRQALKTLITLNKK